MNRERRKISASFSMFSNKLVDQIDKWHLIEPANQLPPAAQQPEYPKNSAASQPDLPTGLLDQDNGIEIFELG